MKRTIMLALLAIVVAGCATTQTNTALTQLQMRVDELERKLRLKEDEISGLKYDVEQLAMVRKTEEVRQRRVEQVRSTPAESKDDIIRVNATAHDVQEALQKAGYYQGNIDGKIGAKTKAAISQFQKDRGLKADGIVGRRTWEELKGSLASRVQSDQPALQEFSSD